MFDLEHTEPTFRSLFSGLIKFLYRYESSCLNQFNFEQTQILLPDGNTSVSFCHKKKQNETPEV